MMLPVTMELYPVTNYFYYRTVYIRPTREVFDIAENDLDVVVGMNEAKCWSRNVATQTVPARPCDPPVDHRRLGRVT